MANNEISINERKGWNNEVTKEEVPDDETRKFLNGRFIKLIRSL